MDTNILVQHAVEASRNAYVPYSNYPVGAALLATDGTIYTGCNVENASYPATICAERTALVKAVSEGKRQFTGLAVATANSGTPCGICRQMLNEFSPELTIVIANLDGEIAQQTTLRALLPDGFGPAYLE